MGRIDVCSEKTKRDSGVKQVLRICQRGSNEVKVWGRWSGFLLVDCCDWVLFLGSACVKIF